MVPDESFVEYDLLEHGAEPSGPTVPRWVSRRLIPVVIVVGLAGAGVDHLVVRHEERGLADCTAQADRAVAAADTRLSLMSHYVAPVLYVVPEGPRRDGLYVIVADAAAKALPAVERALDRCRATSVLPVHRELRDRRTAYLDYLDARVAQLASISESGARYYRDTPELTALRERLTAASSGPVGTATGSP